MSKKTFFYSGAAAVILMAFFSLSVWQRAIAQEEISGQTESLRAAEQGVDMQKAADSQMAKQGGRGGAQETDEDLEDYIIRPGDMLSVVVWDNPNLSSTVSVRDDGNISFPLIGDIKAVGLTVSTFQKNLTEALSKDYIVSPRLVVDVKTKFSKEKFFVYGEVQRPGSYSLEGEIDVLRAISMAGGITDFAAQKVKLLRDENGKRQVLKVNLRALTRSGKIDKRLFLRKDDTIIVERSLF